MGVRLDSLSQLSRTQRSVLASLKTCGRTLAVAALLAIAGWNAEGAASVQPQLTASFESPYHWFRKDGPPTHSGETTWRAVAWRNEKVQIQLLVSTPSARTLAGATLHISDLHSGNARIPKSAARILFPTFVAGDQAARNCEIPRQGDTASYLADALSSVKPQFSTDGKAAFFWLEIAVPIAAAPGKYAGTVTIASRDGVQSLAIELVVVPFEIPNPGNFKFDLDLWQFPYTHLDRFNERRMGHSIEPWSKQHYRLLERPYRYLASLGQKTITTSIKSGALGAPSMVEWLFDRDSNRLTFDYSVFDRHVETLMSWGISNQIAAFSPIGWNKDEIPVSVVGSRVEMVIKAPVGSTAYRSAWGAFLKDFRRHLINKGWFNKTVLYLDEVPTAEMEKAIAVIRESGPDWKIGMAYSHIQSDQVIQNLSDVSGIFETEQKVQTLPGQRATFYTSCTQLRPNSYVAADMSPADNSGFAWYAINRGYSGYLRWAFDNWHSSDALDARDGAFTAGDYAMIYRSDREGFLPSVRSELLRDGIEDYEKWNVLNEASRVCGNSQLAKRLQEMPARFSVQALSSGSAETLVPATKAALEELSTDPLMAQCMRVPELADVDRTYFGD